jgi:hypothetical protein
MYINSTNIPPIMIINRIYETSKSSVAVVCFLPDRAKDLSAPLYCLNYPSRLYHAVDTPNPHYGDLPLNVKQRNNGCVL